MSKTRSLAVMRERFDRNDVLRMLGRDVPGFPVVFERSVLYPYAHFEARCKVPTIGGRKSISLGCVVDGINGHGMTCDAITTDDSDAAGDTLLRSQVSADDAQEIARQTLTHSLGRKLKMIAPFDVHLESRGTVCKRFFIVCIGNDRVMIDSVSGQTQAMRASAA